MSPALSAILPSAIVLAVALVGYLACLGIYRLFLHPLSKFPGPKLAALTKWYEFYHDAVLGGQFVFHLQDLHQKYGPIVRINPDEVHIDDPDFFDELYTKQGKLDKYGWMAGYFGNDVSTFTTMPHELHKARRAPIQPLFSRNRIMQLQPLVREKVKKMMGKIAQYRQSSSPLTISDAYMALSQDVIFEYCFGECYDILDAPRFQGNIFPSFVALSQMGHMAAHLPLIPMTMMSLPESWLEKIEPLYATIFRLKRDLIQWARDVRDGRNEATDKVSHTTVLKAIINSDLPAQEKSLKRLAEEAHVVVGAAVTTTGWAASVATFHLINQPGVLAKLRDELEEAIPDPTSELDWRQLEKLPYLTACIKEGIRLSVGQSIRSPRLSDNVITYKDWCIPPRTPVSMTAADIGFNQDIFPEPEKFIPDRWIGSGQKLDKYFVFFGRGSRSCLGMQLAWAELYHMIGGVFRLFDFELYETDISDVEFRHDFAIPLPKLDSKGVRVKVMN